MATRQQIRALIKAAVAPLFTQTFDYKPAQIYEEDLPSCSVYFEDGETQYDFDEEGYTKGRLVIEIIARDSGNIDSALDQLASSVKSALQSASNVHEVIEGISRIGFAYDRDPESNSGGLSLFHSVNYLDED